MRFAFLLVLIASLSAFAQDDTSRTGVFTGAAETPFTCDAATRTCSGYLASGVDGTFLDVELRAPAGAGPHPLVVVLHGWGGDKESLGYLVDLLLADGHAVLRYSARGFGNSWGQVNLAHVGVELKDLRSLIEQVFDRSDFALNPDAVGITGISYGGGQSWLALLQPTIERDAKPTIRIRTVVPIVPWTDLLYSLVPNGRPEESRSPGGSSKLSYINGLYLGGLRISESRPYPNYPDYLIAWHAWLNAMEPNPAEPVFQQIVEGLTRYRSIWWQAQGWQAHRVPVFQIQGFTDDLFPLTEAKRMLLRLEASGYPIASYFGDLGHPRAGNKTDERDYVVRLIRDWFAWYLRGAGAEPAHVIRAAVTRPREQDFDASRDVITVPTYADLGRGAVSKEFRRPSQLVNPLGDPYSSFSWDPLVMEAARELELSLKAPPEPALVPGSVGVYQVPVSELSGGSELLIAGQPTVSLQAKTTGPRVQLNVRLIDVAPNGKKELITRGTFIVEAVVSAVDIVIPTYGNVWEMAPDHVLQLELTTLDSPYLAPSRVRSATTIFRVKLDIPVHVR